LVPPPPLQGGPLPPQGHEVAMRANTTQDPPYLGFDKAMKKWGMGTEASILQDLTWQREVDGNANKINQFKELIGGLQNFRTYLFIKPGSAFVTVLHSTMKYVAISKVTQHLQGRLIGFVGDHTATKEPTAIVLPQQKTWKWETKMTLADGAALQLYYAEYQTRRGKFWVPDQNDQAGWMATKAPLLLRRH
jgi:hypothetical protein